MFQFEYQGKAIEVEQKNGNLFISGNTINGEILKLSPKRFQIIHKNKVQEFFVLDYNEKEKTLFLFHKGKKLELKLKNEIDLLLEKMGFANANKNKANTIKAPMPGMILNIMVAENQEIETGSQVLILEAMKMENVLKAPGSGKVKKIYVEKGSKVEKNQVLIEFYQSSHGNTSTPSP